MILYKKVADILEPILQTSIAHALEQPKNLAHGDIALPVFVFAKGSNPAQFAAEWVKKVQEFLQNTPHSLIQSITNIGPFINISINWTAIATDILEQTYTQTTKAQTVVIDYSSPNIAKPFGIGHLRSTVIGNAIKNILQFCGHKVIGINYLGDWGTQFGKVICAYQLWGNQEKLKKDPIPYLLSLYVRFHEQAKQEPELEDKAREIFSQLEKGNEQYLAYWKEFRELSIGEFERMYAKMNVTFDYFRGEAYYNTQLESTFEKLKNLTQISEGATIIPLEEFNIETPAMIKKSDGASTYLLRDIAAAIDRIENFHADSVLYEVGSEQKLHFAQLKGVMAKYNADYEEKITHIDHGRYRFTDKKMSTRSGNIILIEDVLQESVHRIEKIIEQKNPALQNDAQYQQIIQDIGIGAIIFADLKNDRTKEVVFDWEDILDIQGESGPYIQYVITRIHSLQKKVTQTLPEPDTTLLTTEQDRLLLLKLSQFYETIEQCANTHKPHTLARYLLTLAQLFNEYYAKHKIVDEKNLTLTSTRLYLFSHVQKILTKGLQLLGVNAVEKM
ncbi:MAG: arginine--tRNA ligase [Candidatus Woesearchaeota archaeon]